MSTYDEALRPARTLLALESAISELATMKKLCNCSKIASGKLRNLKHQGRSRNMVQLTSCRSPRGRERLLCTTKISEAGRATLVVSSLFDAIGIGDFDGSLVDEVRGEN